MRKGDAVAAAGTSEPVVTAETAGSVQASAVTADGTSYSIGSLTPGTTISEVKTLLARVSDIHAASQQLYLIDDTRQDMEDLELQNHEIISGVLKYSTSPVILQFALMIGLKGHSLAEFVKALPGSSPPSITVGCSPIELRRPRGIAFIPAHPHLMVVAGTQEGGACLHTRERNTMHDWQCTRKGVW
jgi:hypothetical protein